MWDKKGDNLTHKWFKLLKEEQEKKELVKKITDDPEKTKEIATKLGIENLEDLSDDELAQQIAPMIANFLAGGAQSQQDPQNNQVVPEKPMQGAVDGQAEVQIAEYTGKITPSKRQRSLDKITSIVLHDTLTSSLSGMIGAFSKPRTYTAKSGEERTYYTGTHFSITADGKVRQHAPLAFPTNHTGTGGWNSKSVGIDIVTRAGGTGAGYRGYVPPKKAQMEALYVLVSQLADKLPALNQKVHWVDRLSLIHI